MKRQIKNIIFIIYILIAIFTTVCLLSYNSYQVSEFGDSSLVIISDNGLEPDFNKGDLVITNKKDTIVDGEKVFFYAKENRRIEIKLGTVTGSQRVNKDEITYTIENKDKISSQYVLGSAQTASVIPKIGAILGVLESKWGFLFLIVLPTLIAFLNQITVVFSEIKNSKEEKNIEK